MDSAAADIFALFETYLERLEGPIAIQVWSVGLAFAKDLLVNAAVNRAHILPTLRSVRRSSRLR